MSKCKIPKEAKCVFKGIVFDVWQWRQKMFDGSFETFEAISRPNTVSVIAITEDKKIIVTKELQPQLKKYFLNVPAGRMDRGEIPKQTAIRELKEETGYKAKTIKLYKKKDFGSSSELRAQRLPL